MRHRRGKHIVIGPALTREATKRHLDFGYRHSSVESFVSSSTHSSRATRIPHARVLNLARIKAISWAKKSSGFV